jgi:type IV pilus assembly protein PilM
LLKSDRFLAVEVGPDSITLAEFSIHTSGRIELIDWSFSNYDSVSSASLSEDAVLATTLKRVLKCKSFSTRNAMIAIGGQLVFSRLIPLPSGSPDTLKEALRDLAEKHIPYPIEEVVWDYQEIESESADPKALLVAIKTDRVEGVSYAVQAAGLLPDRVDIAPAALANAFRYNYPDVQKPVLLLVISNGASNLIFLEGNRIVFRTVSSADFLSEGFIQEIRRSISFYCSKHEGNAPQCVFVSGIGNDLAVFTNRFSTVLSCRVERLDPVKHIERGPEVCMDDSHRLGVVVGLAVRKAGSCAVDLNLMPESLRKERHIQQQLPMWLSCAAGLFFLVGVWAAGLSLLTKYAEEEARQVGIRIAELEQVEEQLVHVEKGIEVQQNRYDTYAEIDKQRTVWLQSLWAVRGMLPEGMFLSASESIRQEEMLYGIRMTVISYLDKESKEGDAVVLLRDRIRSSEYFGEQSEVVSRPMKKKFARSFVIDALFEEPVPQ